MSWHIASVVVRCRAEQTEALRQRLEPSGEFSVRGAERGRLVVLVEGENEFQLADRLAALRALPGVLAADLVHHEIDCDEVADATDTP